ncbi:FG-GAP repeat protein [Streptomyces sp. NPDC044984]|uniref:FG-GAP repeat protein n=1 Tax=Streptomyces sp. NPDC044984 TaxID=3154335 RepID=UPI0033DB3EAC
MPSSRTALAAASALVAALCTPLLAAPTASAAPAEYADDFNGDGYRDYAYGESVTDAGSDGSGTVGVIYGTATGPNGRKQNITQNSAGVPGANEWDDGFGNAMTAADFNRDGYPDLAVAAPGEDLGGHADAGAVHILRGSASGLTGSKSQFFDRASSGVPGDLEAGESFGERLRLRDSDRDGHADLFTDYLRLRGHSGGITASGIQQTVWSDFTE